MSVALFTLGGTIATAGNRRLDGAANVLAACRVACSPAVRDLGALVVFKEEIHAARWVRKTHSTSTATLVSPSVGPIGHVVED